MSRIFTGRIIFYSVLLLALDLSVVPFFQIGAVRPILQYLLILYAAFYWGWTRTIAMAFLVGLMRDMAGSSLMGIETITLVAGSFVLDLLVQKIERERPLLRFLTAFLYVFCITLAEIILMTFLTGFPGLSGHEILASFGTALYTACLMPVFFRIMTHHFQDRVPLKQYELFK